jgi:hypothetical protein
MICGGSSNGGSMNNYESSQADYVAEYIEQYRKAMFAQANSQAANLFAKYQ